MIELVVEGRPVPWGRVRGSGWHTWSRPLQKNHREDVALLLKSVAHGQKFTGPVKLVVDFDFGKDETRIYIEPLLDTSYYLPSRPDTDNLVKQICEAMQDSGIVEDDSQVAVLIARKIR